ncbi:MAG: EscU/YscU/HrcU family type III secretion system export apparatus switch protein, partial [Clostridiales bacterium]|nr:EscU/YscU/HrcU family type III secretion system export apparatus switch protein [Clostridiales bacterium]
MLKYNLQLFAKDGPGGEKTELPTAKKLSDARKEGQVAKSKEVGNGLGLLSLFLVLKMWVGTIGTGLIESFGEVYNKIPEYTKYLSNGINFNDMIVVLRNMMLQILIILMPVFVVGTLVAFFGDYFQVKWRPTTKP